MIDLFEAIGTASWGAVWVPILAWTGLAAATLLVLKVLPTGYVRLQRDLRLALLLALPLGVLAGGLVPSVFSPEPATVELLSAGDAAGPIEAGLRVEAVDARRAWTLDATVGLLMSLFLVVGLMGLARLMWSARQLRKLIAEARPYGGKLPDHVQESTDVLLSREATVPFSVGVVRRRIVVPDPPFDDPRLAIEHEYIHHQHGDVVRAYVAALATAVFAAHPLVHRIAAGLRLAMEQLCDHAVIDRTAVTRESYARMLLSYVPASTHSPAVAMGRSHAELEQRIKTMKQTPRGSRIQTRVLSGLLFLLVSSVVACTQADKVEPADYDRTYEISGVVTDPETGEPLAGANVALEGTSIGSVTDLDGQYIIRSVPAGEYNLRITHSGHEQYTEQISVPSEQVNPFLIRKKRAVEKEAPTFSVSVDARGGVSIGGRRVGDGALTEFLNTLPEGAQVSLQVHGDAPFGVVSDLQSRIRGSAGSPHVAITGARPRVLVEQTSADQVFVIVEEMPELIGGLEALQAEIKYPRIAKLAGIEGRVVVQFVVDESGRVTEPTVIRGIGGGCDEEAVRALTTMRFEPGRQRGQTVKVKMTVPLTFRLENSEPGVIRYGSDGTVTKTLPKSDGMVIVTKPRRVDN